jgi:succinate dehydrogenase / fumarate reductase cytochrome b subunit
MARGTGLSERFSGRMATTVIEKGQPGSRAKFRDSFVLHKLMSLTGLFPIGFFMIQHLIANSYSLRGRTEFNTVVSVFGYLPFVAILEWAIVFIPLLFHAIYGMFIVAEMQGPGGNTAHYGYTRNWLYVLQRWSGVVAFAYIAFIPTLPGASRKSLKCRHRMRRVSK